MRASYLAHHRVIHFSIQLSLVRMLLESFRTQKLLQGIEQIQTEENPEIKMIILTGNSLGERQKELNEKINKTDENVNLFITEDVKTDVDYIFRIDLAARHKNVEFILQILKSGDIVHITRALNKCTWLSNNDFAHIINVDNLHNNIFPEMSIKMKKKLLCALSANLKTDLRTISFYEYCLRERLFNIALKFLIITPETYKLDLIKQKAKGFEMVLSNRKEALANFIGSSFELAEQFLDNVEAGNYRNDVLYLLRYMYIMGEQYLDLLEKYNAIDDKKYSRSDPTRFGRRISKEIIKKHKERVLKYPLLYVNVLNKDIIAKNSTVSDVKLYVEYLMPEEINSFWDTNFYKKYTFIIEVIPADERFKFIKKIFSEKYTNENFEMSEKFYSLAYYNMMTKEEKEIWALNQIATKDEIFGSGNDYMWFRFVSFDKAFEEIKKYVLITPKYDTRMKMIFVLIDSAKTQRELEVLLNYFYNRHVNESGYHKKMFLDILIGTHNVFSFDDKCWRALDSLFHSWEVYSNKSKNSHYAIIALIYFIINKKTLPEALKVILLNNFIQASEIKSRSRELEPEKEEMVFQYIHDLYMEAAEAASELTDEKDLDLAVRFILCYLDLMYSYSKTKDDIPENMIKFITIYKDHVSSHRFLQRSEKFSEKNIMKLMKKDAKLVINEFPAIKQYIENRYGRNNWLIKKLKIYFQHDIAKEYLQLLYDSLSNDDIDYRMVRVAVYGIFILADESFKIEFMKKYVPVNPKIDHPNISRNLLNIQQAICGISCMSRPQVPLTCVNQYLVGDYVKYSLPIFNNYIMNLPLPACIRFVETLIDKPISVQKHGLRLAFQCFSTENLQTLLNDVWKRTKNISLRKVLYKSLYDKVLETDKAQFELFELLCKLTLDLHQDDDHEVFHLLCNYSMPSYLMGQYIVTGWKTVKKLPERTINFERTLDIIESIRKYINLVPKDEVIAITNDHISKMLDEKEILITGDNLKDGLMNLILAKWSLTAKHLTNVNNVEQFEKKLVVVKHLIKKCLEMRYEVCEGTYVVRRFIMDYIREIDRTSYEWHETSNYTYMKMMFNNIIKDLEQVLPEKEIYLLALEISLSNITRDTIVSILSQEFCENSDKNEINVLKTGINQFAEKFVDLLKKLVSNGKYYASFRKLIIRNVIDQLDRVNNRLGENITPYLDTDDLSVLLCSGLLKFEITEIYILILMLLPLNYDEVFTSEYETVLSKVMTFKNDEVQCYMFEKIVNTDFKCRSVMPS